MSTGSLSTKSSFKWLLSSTAIFTLTQWGIVVILAKFTNTSTLGEFALGLAICAPIMLLFNLQLRGVVATDAVNERPFGEYLMVRIWTTGIAFIIITIVAIYSQGLGRSTFVIIAIGLLKSFESISNVAYGLYQKVERNDLLGKSQIARGVSSLIVFYIASLLHVNLLVTILIASFMWFIISIFYDIRNASQIDSISIYSGSLRDWWSVQKKIVFTSIPLGFVMMLGALNQSTPRYFIDHFVGKEILGIFSAFAYILIASSAVVDAVGQSLVARMSRGFAANNSSDVVGIIIKLLSINVIFATVIVAIFYLIGYQVLDLIYGSEYAENIWAMRIMVIFSLSLYMTSTFGFVLTAARQYSVQVPLLLLANVVTVTLSFLTIPKYGIVGAAYCVGLSATAQALVGGGIVYKRIKLINT